MTQKNLYIHTLLIFVIGLILGYGIHGRNATVTINKDGSPTTNTENSAGPLNLENFWKVYGTIKDEFYDETAFNEDKQIDGAIKGMVNSLNDPYTVYMDSEENQTFMSSLDGEFEGIGAELSIRKEGLVVISPLKSSPAEKAGLKSGDIIYKIGDQFASELTLIEAIMTIRGPKDTYVNLTILRSNETEPLELSIKRETISVPSVELKDLGEGIYQISIYQFGDDTSSEFEKIVQDMLLKSPKGLILDLRGNGGGYVDSAIDILSEFVLGKKEAVKIKYRDTTKNYSEYTSEKGRLSEIPMVVLIDNGSASASEIVAGALQDWGRAILIGEKSFGKGSVQEIRSDFANGASLRITIAHWYTPNDRSIQHEGITPDKNIKFTIEGFGEGMDSQLDEAMKELKK